ncbi:MAG: hypothetical protein ABI810_06220 [Sphingomonas bacterium]
MALRFIDWIWHVRGSLALGPQQAGDAFARLAPLFGQAGTSHDRTHDTLTFCKKNPAAQDKMSVFDAGVLQIEKGVAGPVLRYHLTSRILLFCFLAPLLFLGFAQLTIAIGKLEKASAEAAGKSEAAKKAEKKDVALPQNAIDKALGSPAPEKPKKDGAGKDKKPSPTSAYVFAGMFAALYVIGRILEDRLVKRLFKKSLLGS